jgi:hypothetical protein
MKMEVEIESEISVCCEFLIYNRTRGLLLIQKYSYYYGIERLIIRSSVYCLFEVVVILIEVVKQVSRIGSSLPSLASAAKSQKPDKQPDKHSVQP